VVIDSPNVYGMTKGLKKNINFKAFLKHIGHVGHAKGQNRELILKVFYDVNPLSNARNSFIFNLEELGFEPIQAPLKVYAPGENQKAHFKSRTDQWLTVEVMLQLLKEKSFDHLVLVSGDSDYQRLIEVCQEFGKTVEVWATSTTLSNELKRTATRYFTFDDPALKHLLMKINDNRPWWEKQRAAVNE